MGSGPVPGQRVALALGYCWATPWPPRRDIPCSCETVASATVRLHLSKCGFFGHGPPTRTNRHVGRTPRGLRDASMERRERRRAGEGNPMTRPLTGDEYIESLRDDREIYL